MVEDYPRDRRESGMEVTQSQDRRLPSKEEVEQAVREAQEGLDRDLTELSTLIRRFPSPELARTVLM